VELASDAVRGSSPEGPAEGVFVFFFPHLGGPARGHHRLPRPDAPEDDGHRVVDEARLPGGMGRRPDDRGVRGGGASRRFAPRGGVGGDRRRRRARGFISARLAGVVLAPVRLRGRRMMATERASEAARETGRGGTGGARGGGARGERRRGAIARSRVRASRPRPRHPRRGAPRGRHVSPRRDPVAERAYRREEDALAGASKGPTRAKRARGVGERSTTARKGTRTRARRGSARAGTTRTIVTSETRNVAYMGK
jgi:hypothetical protein